VNKKTPKYKNSNPRKIKSRSIVHAITIVPANGNSTNFGQQLALVINELIKSGELK